MVRQVIVVPHNPDWSRQFEQESRAIQGIFGDNLVALHHVGSTAIPNIHAKPIIDILAEVVDIDRVDDQSSNLAVPGYEAMGEYGIPGRRYFRKHNTAGERTHHLHIFQTGSVEVLRHLAFRDYMITHPADARAYSQLKQQLAEAHPTDIEAYMDGKDGFIKAMERKALEWQVSQTPSKPVLLRRQSP
jgi:GrpB-like predicted nucleotidyltransferase (UPF0157 family)